MSRAIRVLGFLLVPALLMACSDDDDGTGPEGNPLQAFVGSYTLSPAVTMTCDLDELGDATITIDTVQVLDADEGQLDLRVPARASGDLFSTQRFDVHFQVAADSDGDFVGGQPLDADFPAGPFTAHGEGDLMITGQFEDGESFGALIDANFAVAVGDGAPTDCAAIDNLLVTGTRTD